MKSFVKISIVALCIVLLSSNNGNSQPPPPAFSTTDQAPIDGGLTLLALGGGALALRKLRKK